jgi:hypothetical protein
MFFKRFFITFFILLMSLKLSVGSDSMDTLQQLGKGQAYYLKFIKVYNAYLYGETNTKRKDILKDTVSKCLHLEYVVNVAKEDFIEAAETVLNRQFTTEQLDRVRQQIDMLHQKYSDVQKGDSYTFCYDGVTSDTTLVYNNKQLITIRSPEFAETYFNIWLGEKAPLDEKLRDSLLASTVDQ